MPIINVGDDVSVCNTILGNITINHTNKTYYLFHKNGYAEITEQEHIALINISSRMESNKIYTLESKIETLKSASMNALSSLYDAYKAIHYPENKLESNKVLGAIMRLERELGVEQCLTIVKTNEEI